MPNFRETDPFLIHQYSENALKAAASGRVEDLKEAIEEGADIEFSRLHVTPLQAALNGNDPYWDCVNVLLDAGANVNVKNKSGWSLLHQAVAGNWPEFVERLLNKSAIPFVKDMCDATPLHVASEKGFSRIAKMLIKTEIININALDIDDETPLMKAAKLNHLDTVKILVESGANLYLKNRDGKNAQELASENPDVSDYLSEQMQAHPEIKVKDVQNISSENGDKPEEAEVDSDRPKLSKIQKRRLS